jgi:phosphotransferase system HPr (HPr) family protein
MVQRRVPIVNSLGLHARAAAQLIRLTGGFASKVTLRRPDTGASADAKSILSILHLAAGYGTTLFVEVEGEDESEAIEAIAKLFGDGFGEVQ